MEKPKLKRWRCPSCTRWISDFPAVSRRDNKTRICSHCGTLEALSDFVDAVERRKDEKGR